MNPTIAPNHAICPNGCGCLVSCFVDGYHCGNCGTHHVESAKPYVYATCTMCKRVNCHVSEPGYLVDHFLVDEGKNRHGRHRRCPGSGVWVEPFYRSTTATESEAPR